jgi:hypothetical protein
MRWIETEQGALTSRRLTDLLNEAITCVHEARIEDACRCLKEDVLLAKLGQAPPSLAMPTIWHVREAIKHLCADEPRIGDAEKQLSRLIQMWRGPDESTQ